MDIKEILDLHDFVSELSDAERHKLESKAKRVRLRDGGFLARQGENVEDVKLIGSGEVRVFLIGPGGREVTLYRLGPGEICGANMMTAMNGGITYINAEAKGTVEMVTIPIAEFKSIFSSNDGVQNIVIKSISERTETLLTLIEGITFVSMEKRVADYLLRKSTPDDNGNPVVNSTHADIATDLGSAREVVSRIVKSLKVRGIVDVARREIKLLRPGMLEKVMGGDDGLRRV